MYKALICIIAIPLIGIKVFYYDVENHKVWNEITETWTDPGRLHLERIERFSDKIGC